MILIDSQILANVRASSDRCCNANGEQRRVWHASLRKAPNSLTKTSGVLGQRGRLGLSLEIPSCSNSVAAKCTKSSETFGASLHSRVVDTALQRAHGQQCLQCLGHSSNPTACHHAASMTKVMRDKINRIRLRKGRNSPPLQQLGTAHIRHSKHVCRRRSYHRKCDELEKWML